MNTFAIGSMFVGTCLLSSSDARRLSHASHSTPNRNPKGYTEEYRGADVAFYNDSNSWGACSTKGVSCDGSYRGIVCGVGEASAMKNAKAEHLDDIFSKFGEYLAYGPKSIEIAKKIAKEAAVAQRGVQELTKMIYEDDLQMKRESDRSVVKSKLDLKWVKAVQTHIKKLHENVVATGEELMGEVQEAHDIEEDSLASLRIAKTNIHAHLAARISPWTSAGLMVKNTQACSGYDVLGNYYVPMRQTLLSLLTAFSEFQSSLEPAIATEDPRQMVKILTPIFEGSGSSFMGTAKKGIVAILQQHESDWNDAQRISTTGLQEQQRRTLGDFAPFGSATAGPFRLYELHPGIARNFLDQEVPQAFLGLAPCLKCQSKVAEIRDLTLTYHIGQSEHHSNEAYVCLRAASKCLKSKVVCGCYGGKAPETPFELMTPEEAPSKFLDGNHAQMGCTHMIYRDSPEAVRSTDAGKSSVAPETTCEARDENIGQEFTGKARKVYDKEASLQTPLRVCMVTWNIGSEREILKGAGGVGWGGVEGDELRSNIDRILRECSHRDNSIVALAFQEGSDDSIVSILQESVQATYGEDWEVQANVYAAGNDKVERNKTYTGYNAIDWIHELPLDVPFTQGAYLAIITHSSLSGARVRSFGLDFKGKGTISSFKNWGRNVLGSSGDKGTAIAQLQFNYAGIERTICFAGSHMDAGSESKRADQAGKTMEALKIIGCPDGVWWGGDFNPRLETSGSGKTCCPWDRLELLMHHGLKDSAIDVLKSIDPISQGSSWRKNGDEDTVLAAPFTMNDWQCQGRQCSAGWHEFPIGFAPTFHKLYDRAARRNGEEGTCSSIHSRTVPKVVLSNSQGFVDPETLGEELQRVNDENSALISSWKTTGSATKGKCEVSGREEICWEGEYNSNACKAKGYCYHATKNSHCPLYTDRILYASKITSDGQDFLELAPKKSPFPIVMGCRYESLPQISASDHSPVISQFTITFGEQPSL